jgi:carbonic anhydrase
MATGNASREKRSLRSQLFIRVEREGDYVPNTVHEPDRATFLKNAGIGLTATTLVAGSLAARPAMAAPPGGPPMAANTPAQALTLLKEGNARFVADRPTVGPMTHLVAELANGQNPFAIVLGCSDSRVPIDTIFDQSPGNVFVVRVAGNFLNDDGLGSIEYGVMVLKSKLIVVLGHSKCGAVTAAVSFVKDGTTQPGNIQKLVTALAPSAQATQGADGDWVANAIIENVKLNVQAMTQRSKIVADAVTSGDVAVVGGIYDLHTGSVVFA